MGKTIRFHGGKRAGSREHVMHHRFDGHKLAMQVNHAYSERAAHAPNIERSGMRGK